MSPWPFYSWLHEISEEGTILKYRVRLFLTIIKAIKTIRMQVSDVIMGRLGNAIFRYLASSLYCILYNGTRNEHSSSYNFTVTDEYFIKWKNEVENKRIPELPASAICQFNGFFQHDKIYLLYITKLKEFIFSHPGHTLRTDDGNTYSITKLMEPYIHGRADTIMHLRLEDFISIGWVIHPHCYIKLLRSLNLSNVCIIMKSPSSELEHKYIKYISKYIKCNVESNDVVTDFRIMRNAKTLICSNSTLSWTAALLSDTISTVYMPNFNYGNLVPATTFSTPTINTIIFEIQRCSSKELEYFFSLQEL